MEELTQTQVIAQALCDPWLPGQNFTVPEGWELEVLKDAFAANQDPIHVPDAYHRAVLTALVRQLPTLGVLPSGRELPEHDAEYQFSRVRCLLCGFGYACHAQAAEALARIHPASPLDPRESEDQWQALAIAARHKCGWPLGLALLPWHAVASQPLTDGDVGHEWLRCVAALHILKHTFYSPANSRLVVVYEGQVSTIDPSAKQSTVADRSNMQPLATALALPAKKGKLIHPAGEYAKGFLAKWQTAALVHRLPTSNLPASVLPGPWPQLVPGVGREELSQARVALTGVRTARAGRIYRPEEVDLSEGDKLIWDWPVYDTATQGYEAERWEQAMPARYDADLLPHQVLEAYCPQVEWISDGHRVLFDSIVIMTLLQASLPQAAKKELPLILVLPWIPTEDDCKNIGKSALAENVLAAVAPTAEYKAVAISDSAPDIRACVAAIQRGGTIGLEEHNYWPASNTHPLSQNSLCLLCQGRQIAIGQVLENNPTPLQLRAPIVLQAKTAPLRSDLKLRAFPIWLRPLTDEEMAHGDRYTALVERQPGRLMRVAAWAVIEKYKLADRLPKMTPNGMVHWKFNWHVQVATTLWQEYTGESEAQARGVLLLTIGQMLQRLEDGQQQAEGSGLQAILDANRTSRLRIDGLWEDFSHQDMIRWYLAIRRESGGRATGATGPEILRAFADATNTPKADVSQAVVRRLGKSARYLLDANSTALGAIMRKELELRMPEPGVSWMLQGPIHLIGWKWVRGTDPDVARFSLLHDDPEALKGAKI